MDKLIKIGEEQIKKLKELQTSCVFESPVNGEMKPDTYMVLNISNQIRDWCNTVKECKDTKHENEAHAKNVENINKATGDLLNLIKVFAPNNKKINPEITVNNSSNMDIDGLAKKIKEQLISKSINLMK